MKKIISLILIGFLMSGCSYLRIHKIAIEQGNVITEDDVSRLHRGMTEAQVKEIMGPPMLTNIFSPGRIDYVYTHKTGGGVMQESRVTCIFEHGRLRDIIRS